jgi:phage shock protein A
MATLNIEAILERVQELKRESEEKDEVIRVQQLQITELEGKLEAMESQYRELEQQHTSLSESVDQHDELVERLSQLLA